MTPMTPVLAGPRLSTLPTTVGPRGPPWTTCAGSERAHASRRAFKLGRRALWHYVKYAEVVDAQRDELPERDRRSSGAAASEFPDIALRPCDSHRSWPVADVGWRLGAIPYYAKGVEANFSDGPRSITELIRAFTAFEPHTRRHAFASPLHD